MKNKILTNHNHKTGANSTLEETPSHSAAKLVYHRSFHVKVHLIAFYLNMAVLGLTGTLNLCSYLNFAP